MSLGDVLVPRRDVLPPAQHLEVLAPGTRASLVAAAGAVRDLPDVSILSRRLCP